MLMVQDDKELRGKGVKVFALCPGLVVSNLRGKEEQSRTAGGYALDPRISGELMLAVLKGERDGDVGKVVKTGGGCHPW